MKTYSHIFLIAYLCLAAFVNSESISILCGSDVKVTGDIDLGIQDFKFTENYMLFHKIPHIRGEIALTNSSAKSHMFSTEMLKLIYGDTLIQRAYLRTIASHVLDGPGVHLNSNQTYKLSVYWPVNMRIGDSIEKFRLVCEDKNSNE